MFTTIGLKRSANRVIATAKAVVKVNKTAARFRNSLKLFCLALTKFGTPSESNTSTNVKNNPKSPIAKKKASVLMLKPIKTAMVTCFKYPNTRDRRFKKEDLNMACNTVSLEGVRKDFKPIEGYRF